MSLMFANSRDHALLALVIREAHQASAKVGGYIGRTAVQKIMYFLKALDVPMGYKFRLYHYGPYSEDLRFDVECLLADNVIRDASGKRKYSAYEPGLSLDELVSRYESELREYRDIIDNTVAPFAELSPEVLELVMTLDYIYREEKARRVRGKIRDSVIKRFMSIKGGGIRKTLKYDKNTVEGWYDMMLRIGLFS